MLPALWRFYGNSATPCDSEFLSERGTYPKYHVITDRKTPNGDAKSSTVRGNHKLRLKLSVSSTEFTVESGGIYRISNKREMKASRKVSKQISRERYVAPRVVPTRNQDPSRRLNSLLMQGQGGQLCSTQLSRRSGRIVDEEVFSRRFATGII